MNKVAAPQIDTLVDRAIAVRGNAYAPYSNFHVGAAVLLSDGKTIITGCNVENASYGLSICAERSAICQTIAAHPIGGELSIVAIAIAAEPLATPCGACRQFIAEFGLGILTICVAPSDRSTRSTFLAKDLLPHGFSKNVMDD